MGKGIAVDLTTAAIVLLAHADRAEAQCQASESGEIQCVGGSCRGPG
jgi:hypothetical protein